MFISNESHFSIFFIFVLLFLLFFKTMSFWLLLKLVHRTEELIISSNSEILCAVKENELRPAKISKYTAQRKIQFGEK